jgi:hypothetical protein
MCTIYGGNRPEIFLRQVLQGTPLLIGIASAIIINDRVPILSSAPRFLDPTLSPRHFPV